MVVNIVSVIIGLLGTIALSGTMSFVYEQTGYTNSTVAFLVLICTILILRYVYTHVRVNDKRGMVCASVYSLGLSFSLVAGAQLHVVENVEIDNPVLWLRMLILTVLFTGPVLFGIQWHTDYLAGRAQENTIKQEPAKYYFPVAWLMIFLCWIPVFLAFYPGAFVYDALTEVVQVEMRMFTTHHPLSHVLMLGGFVMLGHKFWDSYNIGIAMYTLVQMLILSGVFAYSVWYLRKHLSKGICLAVILFYGLFPVIPMYAVCSSKDTLFNGAYLFMLVQLLKILENTFCNKDGEKKYLWKKWDSLLFVLSASASMLFRNNGVLAFGALMMLAAVLAVVWKRKNSLFLKLTVLLLASIVLYGGVNKTLAIVLHADDSGKQEFLTVPIQQLARTYRHSPDVFSAEDENLLLSYLPADKLELYDADLSDPVKAYFNNEKYSGNPAEFWGLWGRMFIKKPATYLNAWLMTSYGYWYPDTVINVYGGQERFTFQYIDSSYFGFETEPPGERDSKFPWLEEQYRRMSVELYQQNVPGISMLFSPGFFFWVFMGCLMLCIYRKNYIWMLPLLSIFLLWGTVIPGPTFLVRYVLILWFALPFILAAGNGQIVNEF